MHYIRAAVPDVNDIVVVTDSDDVMTIDLAPLHVVRDPRRIELGHPPYSDLREMWWVETEADSHLRHFATYDIFFHSGGVTDAGKAVRDRAEKRVAALIAGPGIDPAA